MKSKIYRKTFLTVVFSRDRALQLEGMLRSYFLYCKDYKESEVYILYTASNARNETQYKSLENEFKGLNIRFIHEGNFQNDFNRLVYRYGTTNFLHDYIINTLLHLKHQFLHRHTRIFLIGRPFYIFFLVDDTIFIKPFSLKDIDRSLQANPDAVGFSLRLGLNTDFCYMLNSNQTIPAFTELPGGKIKFKWVDAEYDFGFPLELSSSVYRSEQMLPLFLRMWFKNPHELEAELYGRIGQFKDKAPFLTAYKQSVAFSNPLNMVQSKFIENRHSSKSQYSSEILSKLYDQGYRIDIEKYQGISPNSCHVEMDLEFINISKEVPK